MTKLGEQVKTNRFFIYSNTIMAQLLFCIRLHLCRFSIMAPNVFHIGVKEQVSIAVFGSGPPVNVKLYLQSYPHKLKKFSEVQGRVDQGTKKLA